MQALQVGEKISDLVRVGPGVEFIIYVLHSNIRNGSSVSGSQCGSPSAHQFSLMIINAGNKYGSWISHSRSFFVDLSTDLGKVEGGGKVRFFFVAFHEPSIGAIFTSHTHGVAFAD